MRLVLSLLIAATLAGCAGDAPRPVEDDPFDGIDSGPLESGKGLIRGVVIDRTVMPISGATVKLQGTGQEATSNAEGAFVFSNVDPGAHFIQVSKPGYMPVQQSADVVAGVERPAIVRVQLQEAPGTEPRVQTYRDVGFIGCGWGIPIYYGYCGEVTGDQDDYRLQYDLAGSPDWIQVEVYWTSTQAVTPNLYMVNAVCPPADYDICPGNVPHDDEPDDAPYRWGEGTYSNPAVMRTPAGFLDDARAYHNAQSMDGWSVGVDVSADGPALATGVAIDQEFQGYVTVFWNVDPEDGWTFYEDGEYQLQ